MGESSRIVVVGAGVSGLACARELGRGDPELDVRVLEKSRGVGGRSATRRIRGQAVDHGPAFYHGSDEGFLAALDDTDPGSRLDGWPRRVEGSGRPCEPRAFRADERRLAFVGGMTTFPKSLARGTEVRRGTTVVGLRLAAGSVRADCDDGGSFDAQDVVLALPAPQSAELLAPVAEASTELEAMLCLLRSMAVLRCLTTVAGYAPGGPNPDWDLSHPEDSAILQTVSHDSAKRVCPAWTVLVMQAHSTWSSEHWDEPAEDWAGAMRAEAARRIGPWVARPAWSVSHRWRYARAQGSAELSGPVLVHLAGGARIGFAGEVFGPGGGVQAAWRSGFELGKRMIEERRR